jgi:hypothetical protein
MMRGSRSFLFVVSLSVLIPACYAQSGPAWARDYVYGPNGRLIFTAEPDVYPPTDPMYINAYTGSCASDGVDIQWDNTVTDIGSGVAGYQLYKNGSYMGTFTGDEHWDYSVTGGSSYTYAVNAVDHAGNQSDQVSAEADIPLCTVLKFPLNFFSKGKKALFAGLRLFGGQKATPASTWVVNYRFKQPSGSGQGQSSSPAPSDQAPSNKFQPISFDLSRFAPARRKPDISLLRLGDVGGIQAPTFIASNSSLVGGGR